MKINKEMQIWIVLGIVVGVLLYVFVVYFYIPLGRKIIASTAELEEKRTQLEKTKEVARKYDQAKFKEEQLIKLNSQVGNRLNQSIDFPILFKEIVRLLSVTHATYSSIKSSQKTLSFTTATGGVAYSGVSTDVIMTTSYHNLCDVLSRLSGLAIPMAGFVTDMNYLGQAKPSDQNLGVRLSVVAYQYNPSKQ